MRTNSMRKNGKYSFRAILALACLLSCMWSVTALAAAKVKEVSYEGNGKVEVDFAGKVQYQNVKVKVQNAAGKKVKAVIVDRDREDLDFVIAKPKMGETYTFQISGIRKKGEADYSAVSGSIYVPVQKGSVPVKEAEYDAKDREVEFSFAGKVQWKKPVVEIYDGSKQYQVKITDQHRKELEVKVKKLKKGKIYRYKISGIRLKGAQEYETITGTFMA